MGVSGVGSTASVARNSVNELEGERSKGGAAAWVGRCSRRRVQRVLDLQNMNMDGQVFEALVQGDSNLYSLGIGMLVTGGIGRTLGPSPSYEYLSND